MTFMLDRNDSVTFNVFTVVGGVTYQLPVEEYEIRHEDYMNKVTIRVGGIPLAAKREAE